MGRPSKLTDPLRVEIGKRMAAGEPIRALAREFRIPESTLRKNFSAQAPKIREVAQALATADLGMAALPVTAQRSARSLADQLMAIQSHYATAAEHGARSSERLQAMADRFSARLEERADEVEGLDPKDLAIVAALHETANKGAAMASNLIAANKPKEQAAAGGLESIIDGSWEGKR